MAKGFAAGLVQGALACGAGLVVLSLALPQPPRHERVAAQAALPAVTKPDIMVPGVMTPEGGASDAAGSEPGSPDMAGPEPAVAEAMSDIAVPEPAAPDAAADPEAAALTPPVPSAAPAPAPPKAPAPQSDPAPSLDAPAPPAPTPSGAVPIPPDAAQPDAAEPDAAEPAAPAGTAGIAETLDLPEGSGFARAEDMAPQAPAPLTARDMPQAAPLVMALPPSEAAPGPAEPTALPEARGDDPVAPVMQAPAPDPVDLPRTAREAPVPVPPPGKVQTPGLDAMPDQLPDRRQEPALAAPQDDGSAPQQAVPTGNDSLDPVQAPPQLAASDPTGPDVMQAGLMAPDAAPEDSPATAAAAPDPGAGFDLSTPPDFGALRLTPAQE